MTRVELGAAGCECQCRRQEHRREHMADLASAGLTDSSNVGPPAHEFLQVFGFTIHDGDPQRISCHHFRGWGKSPQAPLAGPSTRQPLPGTAGSPRPIARPLRRLRLTREPPRRWGSVNAGASFVPIRLDYKPLKFAEETVT